MNKSDKQAEKGKIRIKTEDMHKALKKDLQDELMQVYDYLDDKENERSKSEAKMDRLTQSLAETERKSKDLQKVIESLEQKAQGAEEMNKQLKEEKRKLIENQRKESIELKGRIDKLEKQVEGYQLEEPLLKGKPLANYSFRLDLYYPEEQDKGKLSGKITHLLDKKNKSFKGLDLQKIQTFIGQYLPEKIKVTSSVSKVPASERDSVLLKELDIIPDGSSQKVPLVSRHRGFKVELQFEKEAQGKVSAGILLHEAQLHAYSIDEKKQRMLAESRIQQLSADNTISMYVSSATLRPGAYKLIASGKVLKKDGEEETVKDFNLSRFLQVY